MSRLIKCDKCGAASDEDENDFCMIVVTGIPKKSNTGYWPKSKELCGGCWEALRAFIGENNE